jgi:hypothetical protein
MGQEANNIAIAPWPQRFTNFGKSAMANGLETEKKSRQEQVRESKINARLTVSSAFSEGLR